MLIAHVTFQTAAENRKKALDALLFELPAVLAMPGCLKFQPYADPASPTRLGVVHEWEDAESFAAFTASPGFARSGAVVRPLMTAPPVSRRFEAKLLEIVA